MVHHLWFFCLYLSLALDVLLLFVHVLCMYL